MELQGILNQQYDIGRAAIIRAPYWDGSTDFFAGAEHIGNTEGAIEFSPNEEFSDLTLPENMGPGILKRYSTGMSPTFETGVFYSPGKAAMFSPTGSASGGNRRQRAVRTHTLWIVPEQLFIAEDSVTGEQTEVAITLIDGDWLKDGEPFTDEDQRLFDLSLFLWRAQFSRVMPVYRHEDGGKSLVQVTATGLVDTSKPDGHMIWTTGSELADSGIDLEGAEPPVDPEA